MSPCEFFQTLSAHQKLPQKIHRLQMQIVSANIGLYRPVLLYIRVEVGAMLKCKNLNILKCLYK